MKHYGFTLLPSRRIFPRTLLFTLILGSCGLTSCEDELEHPQQFSSKLSFSSEISSSWTSTTRSATGSNGTQNTVSVLEEGDTPLYLHTLYTDSIALPSGSQATQKIETRTTPVKNENMYDTFSVSAYAYTGNWDNSQLPNYFYNATASKSSNNSYELAADYYWPGKNYHMKFFAYAPMTNGNYKLSGEAHPGTPTVSVTVPSDVSKQEDLLVAGTQELSGDQNQPVALTFRHALTAIRFVCGNDMQAGTLKKVTLKGVYSKGVFDMGSSQWTSLKAANSFSQTLDKKLTGSKDEAITTDAQTFMMIPQTLPEGAQLEVVFENESQGEKTLTADLKGTEWPIGKTVTYRISTSSINWTYHFSVTGPEDFEFDGGTKQYKVTSYRENGNGTKEPVEWTAQYWDDNAQNWSNHKPEWLKNFTGSGGDAEVEKSYDITAAAQIGSDLNEHTRKLKEAPHKGEETKPYNLAGTNGGDKNMNTANCYVVDAPGYYSFPLVYGNGIKDGNDNVKSYTNTSATGRNMLRMLLNHSGSITSHYIQRAAKPEKAELLGQDASNLITEVKYNLDNVCSTISFKVDKSTIREGNAIIAIKDAQEKILWSWHIWVTGENLNETVAVENRQNKKYNFMPIVLGWCNERTTTYQARSCKVKFTAGENSQEITINQKENKITFGDNHPYYQWGRKDPFLPSNGYHLSSTEVEKNENKRWFGKDGMSTTSNPKVENLMTGKNCIMNYILKPEVMHSANSADNTYYNLWDITHNGKEGQSVKSIYDPCPAGFKVPDSDAFTGFVDAIYTDKPSVGIEIRGQWDQNNYGWKFYVTYPSRDNDKMILFPALGWRDPQSGSLSQDSDNGNYWTSAPSKTSSAYYLFLKPNPLNVGPKLSKDRSRALAIRPVRE